MWRVWFVAARNANSHKSVFAIFVPRSRAGAARPGADRVGRDRSVGAPPHSKKRKPTRGDERRRARRSGSWHGYCSKALEARRSRLDGHAPPSADREKQMTRKTYAAISWLALFLVSAAYGQARGGAGAAPPPSGRAARKPPSRDRPPPRKPPAAPNRPSANGCAGADRTRPGRRPRPGAAILGPGYEVQPSDLLQVSVWREPDLTSKCSCGRTARSRSRSRARSTPSARPSRSCAASSSSGSRATSRSGRHGRGARDPRQQGLRHRPGQQPGEFIVNPRVDVMQALSLAGGTTAFASPERDLRVAPRQRPAAAVAVQLRCRAARAGPRAERLIAQRRRRRRALITVE